MNRKLHIFLIKLFYGSVFYPLHSFQQGMIRANGIELWVEAFGKKENPALLLIMGCGAPGLLWHQAFCKQVADRGFFVIRYDHRSTGLSSMIDYEKSPYNLMDMANDVLAILDHYGIQKAHIVGGSMGGLIAMLLCAHFPNRVSTLTLIMTTSDGQVTLDAIAGKPIHSSLSPPHPAILNWVKNYQAHPPKTLAEKKKTFLDVARLQNGSVVPFDEKVYHRLAFESFLKNSNLDGLEQHLKAWEASSDLHKQTISLLHAPTLIIHGDQDPIFPLDHAKALKKAIPHAQLKIIPDMGHGLNTHFYNIIIEKIEDMTKP
jgi:pimeloyl-ACP methyl ester carboxylesterase